MMTKHVPVPPWYQIVRQAGTALFAVLAFALICALLMTAPFWGEWVDAQQPTEKILCP
jgi:hypothetical protein